MPRLIGAAQTTAPATQAEQITTFNSSGTLTTQPQTTVIEYLVVAGGGGGQHGGGGGGGFRTGTCNPVTGGSPYPVTVGAGGAADTSAPAFGRISASNGSDSVLGTPVPITSAGGGGGGAAISLTKCCQNAPQFTVSAGAQVNCDESNNSPS